MSQTEKKPRKPYRYLADRVWALIRTQYLAGTSAPVLAERYGLSESALRRRMWKEGWTRRAAAEAEADDLIEAASSEGLLLPETGTGVASEEARPAARAALDEAVRHMRAGRMALAVEAARVADMIGRAAARLGDEAADDGEDEADEAALEALRRKVLGMAGAEGELEAASSAHGVTEVEPGAASPSTTSWSPSPSLRDGEDNA